MSSRNRSRNRAFIEVRVAQLPGPFKDIGLNGDRTVKTAVESAEFDSDGYELRVNQRIVDGDTILHQGDVVTLLRAVEGA